MKFLARIPKLGKTPGQWLAEAIFIVVSVGLGFTLALWQERRADHALAAQALKNLQAEVEYNLAGVESQIPVHAKWVDALAKETKAPVSADADRTAMDIFLTTWPEYNPQNMKSPFFAPRRVAWDTALSTGALRFIDYEIVTVLSDIYQQQKDLESAIAEGPVTSISAYDAASRRPAVLHLAYTIAGIKLTEDLLVASYRRHLPALREAAGSQ